MDKYAERDILKDDPQKCYLTILTPNVRGRKLKEIVSPFLQWIDPSCNIVRISDDKTRAHVHHLSSLNVPKYSDDKNGLSTPALSVMLFLQERGNINALEIQNLFKRYPWKLHHKIELQNRRTPQVTIGQQEFYSISRQFPLWCVCPVHAGLEHLRLNLFVRNFKSMVEFYRLITDSEMESTKPGFCVFPLYSQPGLHIHLCLKHSPSLNPYPLTRAYLTFKIRNIHIIKSFLKTEVKEVFPRHYMTEDPDGNSLILHDLAPDIVRLPTTLQIKFWMEKTSDVTSVKSTCDSHDSGRFSDSDLCSSEIENATSDHRERLLTKSENVHCVPSHTVAHSVTRSQAYYTSHQMKGPSDQDLTEKLQSCNYDSNKQFVKAVYI